MNFREHNKPPIDKSLHQKVKFTVESFFISWGFVVFFVFAPVLWNKHTEAGKARSIMKKVNPSMIVFVDIAISFWGVMLAYNILNVYLLVKGQREGMKGYYLRHVKVVEKIQFLVKIAIMSFGIHVSWTQGQRDLRDQNSIEGEAARKIKSYVDALIWDTGLVEFAILALMASCAFIFVIWLFFDGCYDSYKRK